MKGLIDKNGWLAIERAGKMKSQYCPWTVWQDDAVHSCGDWCSHFGEPRWEEAKEGGFVKAAYLNLTCGGATRLFVFDEFTDERINPDAAQAAKPS